MPSQPLSPILAFFLKLTKFAGEKKVPVLEWLLAWATVIIFGLRYMVDYSRLRWRLYKLGKRVVSSSVSRRTTIQSEQQQQQQQQPHSVEPCHHDTTNSSLSSLCESVSLCPLAHTRKEFSVGRAERWERLRRVLFQAASVLEQDGEEKKESKASNIDIGDRGSETESSASRIAAKTKDWTDEDWIQVVRSNLDVRREASYLMFVLSRNQGDLSPLPRSKIESIVLSKLQRLWPRFLELPQSIVDGIGCNGARDNSESRSVWNNTRYDISLIVPMYKERIEDISFTLNCAFANSKGNPKKIQVVIVHAESSPSNNAGVVGEKRGATDGWDSLLRQEIIHRQHQSTGTQVPIGSKGYKRESTSVWGELKVITIPFGKGGGRGRTLNVGAAHATAPILTFLHSDTMVPVGWDEKIKRALSPSDENTEGTAAAFEGSFPHASAFTMAIDVDRTSSDDGTKSSFLFSKFQTPGLIGAEWLGVLRCYCGLPYGDSVLSFSRPIFDYMGGYPDQPLMEDYEVMDWLRLRSVLLSTMHKMAESSSNQEKDITRGEHLVLLKDRARCSPRRWKKYGVAYTSLINAICIFRYRSKATTEELFDFYYHCNSTSSASNGSSQKK